MKCVACKADLVHEGHTTVTLERGDTTVVIKDVPAHVCSNCGQSYVDDDVTARLLEVADAAAKSGVQVEVRRYAA